MPQPSSTAAAVPPPPGLPSRRGPEQPSERRPTLTLQLRLLAVPRLAALWLLEHLPILRLPPADPLALERHPIPHQKLAAVLLWRALPNPRLVPGRAETLQHPIPHSGLAEILWLAARWLPEHLSVLLQADSLLLELRPIPPHVPKRGMISEHHHPIPRLVLENLERSPTRHQQLAVVPLEASSHIVNLPTRRCPSAGVLLILERPILHLPVVPGSPCTADNWQVQLGRPAGKRKNGVKRALGALLLQVSAPSLLNLSKKAKSKPSSLPKLPLQQETSSTRHNAQMEALRHSAGSQTITTTSDSSFQGGSACLLLSRWLAPPTGLLAAPLMFCACRPAIGR